MAGAYVLINTEVGQEEKVLEQIRALSSVKQAYMAYGTYDLICKLETSDMTSLKNTILTNIRQIEHIESTITLVCFE